MTLHSEASDGAILNYLAGTTDAASSGALRRIAALVAAMQGAGSPEGVLTAAVGSLYTDTTNGVLYIKATGTGNTGWTDIGDSADLSLKANLAGPTFTGTVVLPSTTSIGTVSSTEIGYVDGVTSAIQTQLNAKAPTASPTFTGTVTAGPIVATNVTGHNLLHNGAMQVHQRGTSVAGITTTGTGYNTADRWKVALNAIGTWTQSVEADAPTGSGFGKSLKMLCTANSDTTIDAADYVFVYQSIEGQNLQSVKKGTASAQQLTLSFWVKSNKTGTYVVRLSDTDNTRHVSATYTVDASATWERKTVTFPADTTGALTNDEDTSLQAQFWLAAGSDFTSGTLATTWASSTGADVNRAVGQTNLAYADNNYWQVTGVQLEVGAAATGFEHKDYSQELAECQRYYWRAISSAGAGSPLGGFGGLCVDTGYAYVNVRFPVKMRTTGVGTYTNVGITMIATAKTAGTTTSGFERDDCCIVQYYDAGALTAGAPVYLTRGASASSGVIEYSADL